MMDYPKGSEWRRWDLHVHTIGTLKENGFTSKNFEEFCVTFFKKALENEIAAIGITDYFSVENYKKIKQFVGGIDKVAKFTSVEKAAIKKIFLIPNVELRMVPATDSGRLINIHCLFNPDFVDSLENNFFGSIEHSGGGRKKFKMNRQGMIDLGKSIDPNFDDDEAYIQGVSTFVVTHESLQELKDSNKDFAENVIIAVSNSNNDGASGLQKHYDLFEGTTMSSLDGVRKAIYKISDCIFSSNPKDADYFVGRGVDDGKSVRMKCGTLKPCIHGSDAHTEANLFSPDKNRYCWIKADPTFIGLRQILYEPHPGERVLIGPTRPSPKDNFKVIKNIKFENSADFPSSIEFNQNLCSIIGSRSAGKSALLAYIADAVDSVQTRAKKASGPGEGFAWQNVNFQYSVEWANGRTNHESPGKVVYIPQNYLYEMSGKPEEIKNRIKPVLAMKLPQIATVYSKLEKEIRKHNNEIGQLVSKWFDEKAQIDNLNDELRDLGDKKAVQEEKRKTDTEIKDLKKTHKHNAKDIKKYQSISEKISTQEQRLAEIVNELEQIGIESEESGYFGGAEISLSPSIEELPDSLQDIISQELEKHEQVILTEANKRVLEYTRKIKKEQKELGEKQDQANAEFDTLAKKLKKDEQLDLLIGKSSDLKSTLETINTTSKKVKDANDSLSKLQDKIKLHLKERKEKIDNITTEIQKVDQSEIKDIRFGIEAEIGMRDLEALQQKINMKETTKYVSLRKFDIEAARRTPSDFLTLVYSEKQKVNKGNEKRAVAEDTLKLTEEILFTAEMEGDRIGGFSEPTMTPGKRALFALRLIIAESEDTWPLLIDQPEDDLDSRSIYDEIVPFLREKKKERQIIMVSHNANLVIGADSEQVIVANRHGEDRKNEDRLQFNYLTGSIENKKERDASSIDTLRSQGIREHACLILEGGEAAFEQRSNRYHIN